MAGKLFFTLTCLTLFTICLSHKNRVHKKFDFDQTLEKLELTEFRSLLLEAKLFNKLNDKTTSYTVFAPTNNAIKKAKSLLSDKTRLLELLMYHVHYGSFPTNAIESNMRLKTLLGGQKKIRLQRYRGVNYGSCEPFDRVVDWTYQNGILHTIDGVMKPPEGNFYDILTANPAFSSFLKYLKLAGLQETMKKQTPMTLLVPSDDAFANLPASVVQKLKTSNEFLVKVLQYHVVSDLICSSAFETGHNPTFEGTDINITVSKQNVVFNDKSKLIQSDIIAYNGVIQVIDTVLLPQQNDDSVLHEAL